MQGFLLLFMAFLLGMVVGGLVEKLVQAFCGNTKEGTPSASHNSAMLEIALVLRDLVYAAEEGVEKCTADALTAKMNAVIAQLKQ
jgi:hypothetical protein